METFEQNMNATLEKVIGFGNKIHSEYGNSKLDFPVARTAFDMSERTLTNLKAIKILLQNQEKNNDLEYSIGILLRNNVLDFLILFFIFSEGLNKGKDEMINLFILLQYDHFAESKSYLKSLKDIGFIDDNEMDEMINRIESNFSHYFNFEKLRNEKFPSAAAIMRKLYQNKEARPLLQVVYDAFKFYSNYEHYGFLYRERMQDKITDANKVMKGCMEFCFKTFMFASVFLENEDLYLQAKIIHEEIDWKHYQN